MRDRVLIMGVAGCGKSSVAERVVGELNGEGARRWRRWRLLEADEFHSASNRSKMARGEALEDADRWPWLEAIVRELAGVDGAASDAGDAVGVVVACSALKAAYRRRLVGDAGERWVIVHLEISQSEAARRVRARAGSGEHFMPESLVASQFEALERPRGDEPGVRGAAVVGVDATAAVGAIAAQVVSALEESAWPPRSS